jgi:hypothetical protein
MHFMTIALMSCCGGLALAGAAARAAPTSPLEVKIELRVMDFIASPAGLGDLSVMQYGTANQTLVLSSGSACLRDHQCRVGISTLPEVEIGVDSPAIHAGHSQFADGFQRMVKEY